MRNLVLLQQLNALLKGDEEDFLDRIAVDPYVSTVFALTRKKKIIIFEPATNEIVATCDISNEIPEDSLIVGCQFVPDIGSICYGTAAGDLVVFNVEQKKAECVGFVDSEIRCMAWSPDYEILIITTGNNTLVSMTQEWDILLEVPLEEDSDQKPQENAEVSFPSISWRGDGAFFVVNAKESDGIRRLRVFDRALVLQSVSADPLDLEDLVGWRPAGSSIVGSQRKPSNKHDIVFFERNGLKLDRMDFSLRDDADVVGLQWNAGSDILAVALRTKSGKEEQEGGNTVIQLWYMNNYHWYLKQEIRYPESDLADILWDTENPMLLNTICQKGQYYQYHFCWDPTISDGTHENNLTVAAVIDGSSVFLTPFRQMVIPPPMYAAKLDLPAPASSVSFAPETYEIATLLSDHSIALFGPYSLKEQKPPFSSAPPLNSHINLSQATKGKLRQLQWISANTLLMVESLSGGNDNILEIRFPSAEKKSLDDTRLFHTILELRVLRLFHNKNTNRVFVELIDGSVLLYVTGGDQEPQVLPHFEFSPGGHSTPCPWFASAMLADEEVFIGLTERSKLYLNNTLLSSECNSFALHWKYLLFTTLSHSLRLLRLTEPYQAGTLNEDTARQYDDSKRDLERGSRIAAVVPNGVRVVLQMPRGNLETINPRLLVLTILRNLLDKHEYEEAFTLMRTHRIDLNLLYDHNPADFLAHAEEFVKQIGKVNYLNLFLTGLSNEDVTTTLFYSEYKREPVASATKQAQNKGRNTRGKGKEKEKEKEKEVSPEEKKLEKVNVICDALRAVFNKLDPQRYLLPIITTYVKKDPQELEKALLLIRELRNQQPVEVIDPFAPKKEEEKRKGPTVDEVLDYAIFLVDVNRLFDVALGMYDFDLVMMVAQKSQKDPKEYIPFLNKLQGMEQYFQRYTIDQHLGRHLSSLRNLAKAGPEHFPLCLDIVKKHGLYHEASEIFVDDKEKLKKVIELHADYLLSSDKNAEAGLLYSQIGNYEKGITAFKNANNWQMLFALCNESQLEPEKVKALAYDIAETLQNFSRYSEAAVVLEKYYQDPEQAIVVLIEGFCYREAMRMCHFHGRKDLIETHLKETVQQQYDRWLSKLEKRHRRFLRYKTRLPIARELALKRLQEEQEERERAGLDGNEGNFTDTASEVSDISTTASTISNYGSEVSVSSSLSSTLTKGGSRKVIKPRPEKKPVTGYGRRKRITNKEGGPHEEEWLVGTMKKIIPTDSFLNEMKELLSMLVVLGKTEEAKKLHHALKEYVELVNSASEMLHDSQCIYKRKKPEKPQPLVSRLVDWELSFL